MAELTGEMTAREGVLSGQLDAAMSHVRALKTELTEVTASLVQARARRDEYQLEVKELTAQRAALDAVIVGFRECSSTPALMYLMTMGLGIAQSPERTKSRELSDETKATNKRVHDALEKALANGGYFDESSGIPYRGRYQGDLSSLLRLHDETTVIERRHKENRK